MLLSNLPIERRNGSDQFVQVGSVGPNVRTFTDEAVEGGTQYGYRALRTTRQDGPLRPTP